MASKNMLAAVLLLALVSAAPASALLTDLLPLTPGICAVKIHLASSLDINILNLIEVQLFLPGNLRVLTSQITAALSSAVDDLHDAAAAVDGNLGTIIKTQKGDKYPKLILQYPCPGGSTGLNKVIVINVLKNQEYINRITSFALSFYNDKGVKDHKSFFFKDALPAYLIELNVL